MINYMRFNTDNIIAGLDKLKSAAKPVAKAMAGAATAAIRDKAKSRVSVNTGRLRSALYMKRVDERSNGSSEVYAVSWNHKKAPHGHLVEFGHWTWSGRDEAGRFTRNGLVQPHWVPGTAFLGGAWYILKPQLLSIATKAGRERMAMELSGSSASAPEADNG